jgi:NitT/TauT family transport system substrate-binding protein
MSRKSTAAHRVLTLAGAAVVALSMAACSSESSDDAGSAQVTNLTVGSAPSLAGLGLQVAISQVAACKDNLNVTSTVNKSANDSVPQLLSGGLQVAQMDTITFLQAYSQGLPVQIIAANAEQSTDGEPGQLSSASVVTTPDSPIASPRDLVGTKVGVPAIKTQTWMNIRAIVDADGGDSAQIEFVEVPPAQTIDLLKQGTVDAATPNEPLASGSIASGAVKLVHNTDVPGNKGVPSSVYVAAKDFIAQNPDAIKTFVTCVQEAGKEVNGNPALAAKVAQEQLGYKPEQLTNAFYPAFGTDAVTPAEIDKLAALAVKYEILTAQPNAADILAGSE